MIWSLYLTKQSHEIFICDERDLPWINKKVKQLITTKQNDHKFHTQNI